MANYTKTNVGNEPRTELHDVFSLTGAEVSVNNLPAGGSVPFVHSHRENEEIYAVLDGRGKFVIDGDDVELEKGDWIRIAPSAKRQIFAAEDSALSFICIQTKEGSLEHYTATDAVVEN